MANTPMLWQQMATIEYTQDKDFSFIMLPMIGADSIRPASEERINAFLQAHNCKYKLAKGYGMTEVGSAASMCPSNECNKIGSVGIPFINTTISIFDIETGEELKYGEEGEICISGPSVMAGYFNNDAGTREVLKTHADQKIWMHSGDVGHMDKDGFLYIDGRIKRMLINFEGYKIFVPHIEDAILMHPDIEKCCAIGIDDVLHGVGQIPIMFYVCKKDKVVAEEELEKICKKELAEYYMPDRFICISDFPYTSAMKIDYKKLEKIAETGQ